MNLIDKTGVPIKYPGDGLSAKEINALNITINSTVDAANVYLKDFCNANFELGDLNRQITLAEAVRAVPSDRRVFGQTIKFFSMIGSWVEYCFIGNTTGENDWLNEDNWVSGKVMDGGEW